jgi:hypothetical protein
MLFTFRARVFYHFPQQLEAVRRPPFPENPQITKKSKTKEGTTDISIK